MGESRWNVHDFIIARPGEERGAEVTALAFQSPARRAIQLGYVTLVALTGFSRAWRLSITAGASSGTREPIVIGMCADPDPCDRLRG